MKVLAVLGSPRKNGNSTTLARRFLNVAEHGRATIKCYRLNELDYKPCQACYACKTRLDHCALEDDLTPVLQALAQCDVAVIATPVYYGDISAQTKAFIDRTFSFVKPDFHERDDPVRFAPGKKMVWIITQESPEGHHDDIFERYGSMFKVYAGFDTHLIRAAGVEAPGEVSRKPEILEQTEVLARQLFDKCSGL